MFCTWSEMSGEPAQESMELRCSESVEGAIWHCSSKPYCSWGSWPEAVVQFPVFQQRSLCIARLQCSPSQWLNSILNVFIKVTRILWLYQLNNKYYLFQSYVCEDSENGAGMERKAHLLSHWYPQSNMLPFKKNLKSLQTNLTSKNI